MSSLDDYLGHVQATIWSAADFVSEEGVERAQHLVDHGEPAEGMCSLAWIIVNEKTLVPESVIQAIRKYSEELVPAEFMPQDLDAYGIPDEGPRFAFDSSSQEEIRGRVRGLLITVADQLPARTTDLVDDLLDANEQGVAVEMMSEMLVEAGARISSGTFATFERVVDDLQLDPGNTERLRSLVALELAD